MSDSQIRTPDQIALENDWLRRRVTAESAVWSGTAERAPREWGVSSNALVVYMIGGPLPTERQHPLDRDDLDACERAVASAPEHLKEMGEAVLEQYRLEVERRFPLERPALSDDAAPAPTTDSQSLSL
jgi:hypothetical protein